MLRLLIATPLYPPELGGPATYARALETGLPAGHDVQVTVVKFGDVRKWPKGIAHLVYFFHVLKAAKEADVVFALDAVSVGLAAWCAARLRRVPFIVKVVGDHAWEQARQRFGVRQSLDEFIREKDVHPYVYLLRRVQTFVASEAARVIVPSRYLGGIVRAWGVSPERISVIYNAVPQVELGTVPEAVANAARPRIVTVGRLVPWKNMGGVIDAVAHLATPATLVIIGEGPDREHLEKYAQTRLPGRTTFTGPLAHADVQAVIKEADVFVLNSTYEGLSHVLIEALALGTPIVATRAGGNPEVVEDGVTGRLIPVNDSPALTAALQAVLDNPTAARAQGERARADASRFSRDAMLEGTYAVLALVAELDL